MRVVHPRKYVNRFLALLLALGLGACASTASREPQAVPHWQYQGQKFGALRVSVSPAAQVKLADEAAFDVRRFEQTVLEALEEQQLFDRRSGYSVTVEVTDARFGVPAPLGWSKGASGVVTGKVTLKHPSGRELYRFDVSASCAPGDAGAPAEWLRGLYEEFAVLTVIQILNGAPPRSAYASL